MSAVAAPLGPAPERTRIHHVLSTGEGRVWTSDDSASSSVVVEWTRVPGELEAAGEPIAIGRMLLAISHWACVVVLAQAADVVAASLEDAGIATTRLDAVVFELSRGPEDIATGPRVTGRLLDASDWQAIATMPERLFRADRLPPAIALDRGLAAGTFVDGQLISVAMSLCVPNVYGSIDELFTRKEFYGHSYGAPALARLSAELTGRGLAPVLRSRWDHKEDLLALEQVGFVRSTDITYISRDGCR